MGSQEELRLGGLLGTGILAFGRFFQTLAFLRMHTLVAFPEPLLFFGREPLPLPEIFPDPLAFLGREVFKPQIISPGLLPLAGCEALHRSFLVLDLDHPMSPRSGVGPAGSGRISRHQRDEQRHRENLRSEYFHSDLHPVLITEDSSPGGGVASMGWSVSR